MSARVFSVSKETQQRAKLGELREEMAAIPDTPAADLEEKIPDSLESLVEEKLKYQMKYAKGEELSWAIVNSIKFLAVRSRIPIAFGTELDQPPEEA